MNEFIEKNRQLFNFYCFATRIIGWLLLVFAAIIAVIALIKILSGSLVDEQKRMYSYMLYLYCHQLILTFMLGLVLLGFAQFVRYLYQDDYQPGWLFRHGNKVLYFYAFASIVSPFLHYFLQMSIIQNSSKFLFLLRLLPMALPGVAKGLIFIGIAQVFKHVKPIVEESKTLV